MTRFYFKLCIYIALFVTGVALVTLALSTTIDSFWAGAGCSCIVIPLFYILRMVRYKKDPAYAEKIHIRNGDERNRSLSEKARAYGYTFGIFAESIGVIILQICRQPEFATVLGLAVCAQLLLYCGFWLYLRLKY